MPLPHVDCDNCASMAEELAVARDLLRKSYWLPVEGETVAVVKGFDREANDAIVQYLVLIGGCEPYKPKEKK